MADPYQIPLSADNITSYLEKVRDASITIADDSKLVRSSAIYNKFAATDATVAANTADIAAIQDAGGAAYTFADTVNYDANGALGSASGWAVAKSSTWSSIASGVVTISKPGVYMVFVQGTFVGAAGFGFYRISVNIDGVVSQNAHLENPTTVQEVVDIYNEGSTSGPPNGIRVDTQKIVNLTSGTTTVSIIATKVYSGRMDVTDCGITILKLA